MVMFRRKHVRDDRLLAERLATIKIGDVDLGEITSGGEQEAAVDVETVKTVAGDKKACWYSIAPRLGKEVTMDELVRIVGERFTLFYAKNGKLYSFIYTTASKQSLAKFFDASEAAPKPYDFMAKAGTNPLKTDKYYFDFYISDLPGFASRLPDGCAVSYSVSFDPWLLKLMNSKRANMEKKVMRARYSKDGFVPELYEPVRKKVMDGFYLVSTALFANSKEDLKTAKEIAEASLSAPISFSTRKLPSKEEKKLKVFLKELEPPRINGLRRIRVGLGLSGFLTVSKSKFEELIALPDPRMHDVSFVRAASIPVRFTEKGGIRLGELEDGRPFSLSPDDLFRHAYIIGQTGTGKTNMLKLLARRLHALGYPVFVIDPHGDLSIELATTTPDAVYLHPTKSPFGINPLELPPLDNRDQAITISLDTLINLFTNVFKLPETAVNVRYILQTVARQIYNVGGTPTLAGIYKIVMGIYNGADVGITDESFREQEKLLRNMPDQSFISTLGRLQGFAEDPILRRLTSNTTIDLNEFIDNNRMVLFSVPQPDVGLVASSLVCSTLLLKIYYTLLARARNEGERKNVFVIIDEFQTLQSLPILANILSEARKFGLHLIIAHQYAEQLTDELFQSAMNNTGVKFVYQISGADVHKFKTLDPAFADEIASIATTLPTGKCLVKISTRPEDADTPPFMIKTLPDTAPKVRELMETCTMDYEPEDVELDLSLVNPILRYIDLPFPPRQKIISALLDIGGEAMASELHGHVPYLRQDAFNKILSAMQAQGYVRIRRSGKGRVVTMTDKFFEEFYKVAPSEKGKKLLRLAAVYYMREGYYVAPTKNIPIPRPDIVAIPYKDFYLDYSSAIEVEVEATTAEKKPEHLKDTARKGSPFKEKHVWCSAEDFPTVVRYLNENAPKGKEILVFRVSEDEIRFFKLEDAVKEIDEVLTTETGTPTDEPLDTTINEEQEEATLPQPADEERVVKEEAVKEHKGGEPHTEPAKSEAVEVEEHDPLADISKALDYGIDEDLILRLEEAAILREFVEKISECVDEDELDDDTKEQIVEAARAVLNGEVSLDDIYTLFATPIEREAAEAVANAIRENELLMGREDIVDEMLPLATTEDGRGAIMEVAKMGLDADTTVRVLKVLNAGGLRYLEILKKARDINKILLVVEERLGITTAEKDKSESKVDSEVKDGDKEWVEEHTSTIEKEADNEEADTSPTTSGSTPTSPIEATNTPKDKGKKGKKVLSEIVVGSIGTDGSEDDDAVRRKGTVVINGRKIAVLKGERQTLKLAAGMSASEVYLVDERKTPISGSKLPEEGLMTLEEAPPGKYTLLIVSNGIIKNRFIVEVLE